MKTYLKLSLKWLPYHSYTQAPYNQKVYCLVYKHIEVGNIITDSWPQGSQFLLELRLASMRTVCSFHVCVGFLWFPPPPTNRSID